jgi:hypothetical protein
MDTIERTSMTTATEVLPKPDFGLTLAGYLTGALLPIIGFFVGLALIIRGNRPAHGVLIMVVAVIFAILWIGVLTAAATEDLNSYSECLDQARNLAQMSRCE